MRHHIVCGASPDPDMLQGEQQGAARNSVVINGTTYTGNGLANGYINPDVIPSSVPDLGSDSVMSGESEEARENRINSQQGAETDHRPHR